MTSAVSIKTHVVFIHVHICFLGKSTLLALLRNTRTILDITFPEPMLQKGQPNKQSYTVMVRYNCVYQVFALLVSKVIVDFTVSKKTTYVYNSRAG